MPDRLLTAQEVKEQFGISRTTLLNHEKLGRINPARTPGRQRRYSAEEVQGLFVKPSDNIVTQKPTEVTFSEFGVTGLRKWGGGVFEERLASLRGRRGRILLREMHLNDPVIAAIFFAFDSTLREASWRVKPFSEAAGDIAAAKFLEECIGDMDFSWNDTLSFIV